MIAKPPTVMPISLASASKPRGCRKNRSMAWLYFAARNAIIIPYRTVRPASTADANLPCGYRSAPAPTKNAEVGNGGGAIHETSTAAKPNVEADPEPAVTVSCRRAFRATPRPPLRKSDKLCKRQSTNLPYWRRFLILDCQYRGKSV